MMHFQLASVGATENIEITAHEAVTTAGDVRIRPATVRDAGAIARLYSISSDGVADYIWTEMAERGEDPITVGERRYARKDTDFSNENCTIVEADGYVAGMLVAFPMHVIPGMDAAALDPVLAPYAKLEEDAGYYLWHRSLSLLSRPRYWQSAPRLRGTGCPEIRLRQDQPHRLRRKCGRKTALRSRRLS